MHTTNLILIEILATSVGIIGFLIYLHLKVCKDLEKVAEMQLKLVENQKFHLLSNALIWALDSLEKGIPNPIELPHFEPYNLGYKRVKGEMEQLGVEILNFNKQWIVNPELFKSEREINACKNEALHLLENIQETLNFHHKLQDTFNHGYFQLSKEIREGTTPNSGFAIASSCIDTAKSFVASIN